MPELQEKDDKSPPGQTYPFTRLTKPSPIRLISLLSSSSDPNPQYTLREVSLSATPPPSYVCLSYTWGPPLYTKLSRPPIHRQVTGFRDRRIQCDGEIICVSENLYSALMRLRELMSIEDKEGNRMAIWIDAICIHQENTNERSSQVAKMDKIYAQAEKVIVWLGPSDVFTEDGISVLRRLAAVPEEKCDTELPDGLYSPNVYKKLGISPIYRDDWVALGALLLRTWFNRVWVLQETFAAREVLVLCGEEVLKWEEIVVVSRFLQITRLGREVMELMVDMTDDSEGEYAGNIINNQTLFEALREQKGELKLETLLTYSRYFSATVDLDHVYGVRGMWEPKDEHRKLFDTITPNYKLDTETVFANAAMASIIEIGDLNILSLVEDNSLREEQARKDDKKKPKKIPSWVPDYNITPIAEPLAMNPRPEKGDERWYASRGLKWTAPFMTEEKHLSGVKGLYIDTVDETAATETEFRTGHQVQTLLFVLLNYLDHLTPTQTDPIDVFCRTIIKDTYRGEEADSDARNGFAYFLAGRIATLESFLEDPPTPDTPLPFSEETLNQLEPLIDKLAAMDQTGTIPNWSTIHKLIDGERDIVGVNSEYEYFHESFRLAYLGRRLFRTRAKNLLGVGPQSLKKGDEVWLVAGADVPMVLRPLGVGKWKLVGEGYVHEIMKGEAVEKKDGNREGEVEGTSLELV